MNHVLFQDYPTDNFRNASNKIRSFGPRIFIIKSVDAGNLTKSSSEKSSNLLIGLTERHTTRKRLFLTSTNYLCAQVIQERFLWNGFERNLIRTCWIENSI